MIIQYNKRYEEDVKNLLVELQSHLVDLDKEIEKVKGEIEKMRSEIKRGEGMLGNAGFVARAPQSVVENERQKLSANLDKLAKLQERLAVLENN